MRLLLRAIHCNSSSCVAVEADVPQGSNALELQMWRMRTDVAYENAGGCTSLWLKILQIENIFLNEDYCNELLSAFR
jgi:hypothetical protein